MKLIFQYIEDEDDSLMFLVLRDEDRNKELMRVPVLVSNEDAKKMPQLKDTLKTLPVLLKTIYRTGLNQKALSFEEENEQL